MALKYGFGLYDDQARVIWDRKYNELSDKDKEFYNWNLAYLLIIVDISTITPESIPHIVGRFRLIDQGNYNQLCCELGMELGEYLKRFIGFQTNVRTTPSVEFYKKLCDWIKMKLPKLNIDTFHDPFISLDKLRLAETKDEDLPLLFDVVWHTEAAAVAYKLRLANAKIPIPGDGFAPENDDHNGLKE